MSSLSATVAADILWRNPHPLGGRRGLVENIYGDTTSGIPVAADSEPLWLCRRLQSLGYLQGALLMENSVVAVGG